jgi:hypothetical protein
VPTAELFNWPAARLLAQLTAERRAVNLVFGSPPYAKKARRYARNGEASDFPEDPDEWAREMAAITLAAVSACDGMVFWVVNSPVASGEYRPAVERLLVRLADAPQLVLKPPHVWHKNGSPGSPHWPSRHWEQVVGCHRRGLSPHYLPAAIGSPRKFASGPGSQRGATGERKKSRLGVEKGALARPSDVVRVTVGGGSMGRVGAGGKTDMADDALACSGEAPYPAKLAAHFVRGFCPPGGVVCDPFAGTGSTAVAAVDLGRSFVGGDVRASQTRIAAERLRRVGVEPAIHEGVS